jgi:type II secretion system protein C
MKPLALVIFFLSAAATLAADEDTLRLVGTLQIAAIDGGPSHAVFAIDDGRQLVVDVGQEVRGCMLLSVGSRRAELECADGMITLTLRSDLRVRDIPGPADETRYQITLPRDTFVELIGDRQRVARQLSLQPAVRDGWLQGYRVSWLEEGGDFHRLGLRADDVIVSLNGVAASNPGPFMQALGGLRGQSSFQLVVERAGEQIAYSYLLD